MRGEAATKVIIHHLERADFVTRMQIGKEGDVLEALGEYVNIKTLKGRFMARKFSTGWAVGVVKSVENKTSVACQFAVKYKSETYC